MNTQVKPEGLKHQVAW